MFDANLNGLPAGERFVAEVSRTEPNGRLHALGVRQQHYVVGMVLHAQSEVFIKDCNVVLDVNGTLVELTGEFDMDADFLIFECRIPTAPEYVPKNEHPLHNTAFIRHLKHMEL
jgi:hypothetical protein